MPNQGQMRADQDVLVDELENKTHELCAYGDALSLLVQFDSTRGKKDEELTDLYADFKNAHKKFAELRQKAGILQTAVWRLDRVENPRYEAQLEEKEKEQTLQQKEYEDLKKMAAKLRDRWVTLLEKRMTGDKNLFVGVQVDPRNPIQVRDFLRKKLGMPPESLHDLTKLQKAQELLVQNVPDFYPVQNWLVLLKDLCVAQYVGGVPMKGCLSFGALEESIRHVEDSLNSEKEAARKLKLETECLLLRIKSLKPGEENTPKGQKELCKLAFIQEQQRKRLDTNESYYRGTYSKVDRMIREVQNAYDGRVDKNRTALSVDEDDSYFKDLPGSLNLNQHRAFMNTLRDQIEQEEAEWGMFTAAREMQESLKKARQRKSPQSQGHDQQQTQKSVLKDLREAMGEPTVPLKKILVRTLSAGSVKTPALKCGFDQDTENSFNRKRPKSLAH